MNTCRASKLGGCNSCYGMREGTLRTAIVRWGKTTQASKHGAVCERTFDLYLNIVRLAVVNYQCVVGVHNAHMLQSLATMKYTLHPISLQA